MDINTCAICLDEIKEKHLVKKLSCGHEFHYSCIKKLVFHHTNFFIPCPICREINHNVDKPFKDPELNIRFLCSSKVGKVRCVCQTNHGKVCKRKSKLLNYGYCYQHNKDYLREDKYPLMEKFMYLILYQKNSWLAKLYLMDIGKKIIIHKLDKTSSVDEIFYYFYRYMNVHKVKYIDNYKHLYSYYELELPNKSWLKYCNENYTLI